MISLILHPPDPSAKHPLYVSMCHCPASAGRHVEGSIHIIDLERNVAFMSDFSV